MWQHVIQLAVAVVLVIGVSEVGKHRRLLSAVPASLPISLVARVHLDPCGHRSTRRLSPISRSASFWLILATLPLFLALPALLHRGAASWPALGIARDCDRRVFRTVWQLGRFGVSSLGTHQSAGRRPS